MDERVPLLKQKEFLLKSVQAAEDVLHNMLQQAYNLQQNLSAQQQLLDSFRRDLADVERAFKDKIQ